MTFKLLTRPLPESAVSKPQVLAKINWCVRANVKQKPARQWLLRVLAATDDAQVRNQATLALGDLGVQEAFPIIIRLLAAEATANNRGSLLFALQSLDYRSYLPDVARQLGSGVYEVMELALCWLEQLPGRLKARQTRSSIELSNEP